MFANYAVDQIATTRSWSLANAQLSLAKSLASVVGEEDGDHGVHSDGVDSNRAQLITQKKA